jgi:hypothetical protein
MITLLILKYLEPVYKAPHQRHQITDILRQALINVLELNIALV